MEKEVAEMKHTRTPWRFHKRHPLHDGPCIDTMDGEYVASTANDSLGIGLADAKRIVACVNGCEGINPDAVKPMLEALKRYVAEDECDVDGAPDADNRGHFCRWCQAVNAIALAEGRS